METLIQHFCQYFCCWYCSRCASFQCIDRKVLSGRITRAQDFCFVEFSKSETQTSAVITRKGKRPPERTQRSFWLRHRKSYDHRRFLPDGCVGLPLPCDWYNDGPQGICQNHAFLCFHTHNPWQRSSEFPSMACVCLQTWILPTYETMPPTKAHSGFLPISTTRWIHRSVFSNRASDWDVSFPARCYFILRMWTVKRARCETCVWRAFTDFLLSVTLRESGSHQLLPPRLFQKQARFSKEKNKTRHSVFGPQTDLNCLVISFSSRHPFFVGRKRNRSQFFSYLNHSIQKNEISILFAQLGLMSKSLSKGGHSFSVNCAWTVLTVHTTRTHQ